MNSPSTREASDGRRQRWWTMWPGGISTRVALILMLCLLVGTAVSIGIHIHDRADATINVFAQSAAGRIEAIVRLMDDTAPAKRTGLISALSSPTLWVHLPPEGATDIPESWEKSSRASRMVRRYLPAVRDRIGDIRVFGHWGRHFERTPGLDGRTLPDLMPSRRKLLISIALRDGAPIRFVVASDTTSLRWAARIGFWLLLTALFIIAFSLWAGRRLTRPLRRFAAAADQLGLDVRAPQLPEQGSRELRRATRAFNRMQDRIRRLVDDRTMMMAAISHDLRTMLTRLRLRAEFIDDTEQQHKALADIDEMQTMLESTLSFARTDTETEARTNIDIAALLQSLCDDLSDTGHKTAYDGPDRLIYHCAPVSLKRALGNLLENAIKYGGEASAALKRRDDGAVEIVISDRGPGIPTGKREKVFQPFFRLDPSRSRETGGAGLGLSVARSIVRRHGGDIELDDREGGGLEVRISLPGSLPDPPQ